MYKECPEKHWGEEERETKKDIVGISQDGSRGE